MGGTFGSRKETKPLMVGLDAAGKTTILYKLSRSEVKTTIPTIGFNVESCQVKSWTHVTSFTVWDISGRSSMRPLYRHFYRMTNALIFVVDSNDRDRIEDAAEQLTAMLQEAEFQRTPVLVFANKQDVPNAMSVTEVAEKLGLHKIRQQLWHIQGSCATSGEGLDEGLKWLQHSLHERNQNDVEVPRSEVAAESSSPTRAKDPEAASDADTDSTADTGSLASTVHV